MKKINSFLEDFSDRKMLVVYPHPDDESVMAGGLIQRAISLGFQVTVLTITEGNRGKIYINGGGRSVSEIRRLELAEAMSTLGVSDWVMWKFEDGKLRKRNNWRKRLRRFIEQTDPKVVASYDLSGVTSHPDHIALSLEVLRIFKRLKSFKLLWTGFEGRDKEMMVDKRVVDYLSTPRYELGLTLKESRKKWVAAFAHKSQRLMNYLRWPWWVLMFSRRQEWYSEADIGERYKYKYVGFKI